ncbi:MAG: MBL fold metallo-hydrolase [Deltaproteobacteria bacterium]|nr:MBL fold metallo-hydrolase [Deltaproteobacteria bacterium]
MQKRVSRSILAALSVVVATACATPAPSPSSTAGATQPAAPSGPPAGLGRRDNAATIGPFGSGALTLRAHQSAEYSATVNSWLLETATEVAIVDAQLVMPEAQKVVELVRSTGKKLAWVWVSHGHPDHYAGLEALATAFPGVPLYARSSTVTDGPELLKKFDAPLQKFFPGEMTKGPMALSPYTAATLAVGGVEVKIVDIEGGEHPTSTMLVIPSLRGALVGDLVYHKVHPWLNEMDDVGVLKHVDMLSTLADVDTFYPGHGEPFGRDFLPVYRGYVTDFLAEVPQAKDGNDLIERVWRRYPDWRTMAGLRFSANAYIGARASGAAK